MKCQHCKNYVYHTPTWQDPSYDEYCKVYGDFSSWDGECKAFSLSKYGKFIAARTRTKKLERILKNV